MKRTITVLIFACIAALAISGCGGSATPKNEHEGQAQIPISAEDAKGENYSDVALLFEKAGFINVTEEGLGDLITGWLTSEGDVDKVSVDGDTKFEEGEWCSIESKVVIRYHSFPEKDSSEAAEESDEESDESLDEASDELSGEDSDEAQDESSDEAESASESAEEQSASAASSEKSEAVEAASESAESSKSSDSTSKKASVSIDDCKGKTAAKANSIAKSLDYSVYFYDSAGRDVTDVVVDGEKSAAIRKATVSKVEVEEGFFGSGWVNFTLKYSTKKKMKSYVGKTAAQAANAAKNNAYEAEFIDKSGDDITDEVTGKKKVKAARNAVVTKVTFDSGLFGDCAQFKLDYGVPKEYKTALKKAQSYVDNLYMSKAALYDQMTSEYGEKYSADAAQYAVDNVKADWKKNALKKARSYQDNLDISPAAIYDQLTSYYGEQFTAEEAQYAIDNL